VLSEYRQRHQYTDCRKFVAKEKRQTVQPAASRWSYWCTRHDSNMRPPDS